MIRLIKFIQIFFIAKLKNNFGMFMAHCLDATITEGKHSECSWKISLPKGRIANCNDAILRCAKIFFWQYYVAFNLDGNQEHIQIVNPLTKTVTSEIISTHYHPNFHVTLHELQPNMRYRRIKRNE